MDSRKRLPVLSSSIAFLMMPAIARADAGTALMWLGIWHLLPGNALIGFAEGVLVSRLFGFPRRRSIIAMIAANYLSTAAGVAGVAWLQGGTMDRWLGDDPLHRAPWIVAMLFVVAFVASVVLEWPVLWFAVRRIAGSLRRSFAASAAAQVASYAVLVPLYWVCSNTSLYNAVSLESVASFAGTPNAVVYFIGPTDGDVHRIGIDGKHRRRVLDGDPGSRYDRLFVRQEQGAEAWDLWVLRERSDSAGRFGEPQFEEQCLLRSFAARATPTAPQNFYRGREPCTRVNFLGAATFSPDADELTRVDMGYFPGQGIRCGSVSVAFETPFIAWFARNATILPDGQVVYQLGNQIVLLDERRQKLGLITRGRGPVVVLEEERVAGHSPR